MLNAVIAWSIRNRLLVLVAAAAFLAWGGVVAINTPIDVFPDLTAPTVTVLTEAHGLAPEEVETLVTLPLESALNGTTGVFRVRSNSAIGISIVFVEFDLGTDIFRARQLVTEKLQQVRLPAGTTPPVLGPISSTMGEIMLISMTSTTTTPMELSSLAEWVVRPRLLGVTGVSQVKVRGGTPVLLGDVATVRVGPALKRGDASYNMRPAVVATIQKQPHANTLDLTARIEATLAAMKPTLPRDVVIDTSAFQQADFIQRAIGNVNAALLEGAIMVTIVLFVFLWNFRTTFISLTALPLSLVAAVVVMDWFGMTVNTMTLGGLAMAIGQLVDDAIVDVENVFRRLKQNAQRAHPDPATTVVFRASSEIRHSITFATLIIVIVFLPLLSLGGFEGRMFAPLAVAYIVSITVSLLVALTVTPVLSFYLLSRSKTLRDPRDSFVVAWLKRGYAQVLAWTLRHSGTVVVAGVVMLAVALACVPFMGRLFLPPLNEGKPHLH